MTTSDVDDVAVLASTARSFFASFVDNDHLNDAEASEAGYEAARWSRMAELGWTAINLPTRVGGAGGSLADAAAVAREAGRAAYASPLLATMRAATVLIGLDPDKRFDGPLTRIADGVPAALVAPADPVVRAARDGDRLVLAGPAVVAEWVRQSELVVIVVPTEPAGRSVCLALPRAELGERVARAKSVDNESVDLVDLDGLSVPADSVQVAAPDATRVLGRADLLRASTMVGGCAAVLDMTARYALQREQFGAPIGSFQAVRHHLARMAIAADAALLTCDEALALSATGDDRWVHCALAAFTAGRSYVEIVLTGAQVHGGIGTTTEHVLHHHYRRAKAMQLRFGKRGNRLREIAEALVVRREAAGPWS
jgi:alkylation response protein AidB-like acyl-CoA dehydrogenase